MEDNIILKMIDIEKHFHGVHALKKCNFELKKGEVHALMGENGAGKSTLMKVLCGIHKPESGEIILFDEKVSFNGIKDSQEKGISIIPLLFLASFPLPVPPPGLHKVLRGRGA